MSTGRFNTFGAERKDACVLGLRSLRASVFEGSENLITTEDGRMCAATSPNHVPNGQPENGLCIQGIGSLDHLLREHLRIGSYVTVDDLI